MKCRGYRLLYHSPYHKGNFSQQMVNLFVNVTLPYGINNKKQ